MIRLSSLAVIALLAFFMGCSSFITIVPPKIQITGEKTVIEKQIIGEYRELEKDAWVISSIRTTVQRTHGSSTASASDPELFKALKIREYHTEKLRTYKDNGAVGEANNGYVVYIANKKYEADESEKAVLLKVIEEENKARKTIFIRSLFSVKNEEPDDEAVELFGRIFSQDQASSAIKNDWIQNKSGEWDRKR